MILCGEVVFQRFRHIHFNFQVRSRGKYSWILHYTLQISAILSFLVFLAFLV
jgi:hypothetical protein